MWARHSGAALLIVISKEQTLRPWDHRTITSVWMTFDHALHPVMTGDTIQHQHGQPSSWPLFEGIFIWVPPFQPKLSPGHLSTCGTHTFPQGWELSHAAFHTASNCAHSTCGIHLNALAEGCVLSRGSKYLNSLMQRLMLLCGRPPRPNTILQPKNRASPIIYAQTLVILLKICQKTIPKC